MEQMQPYDAKPHYIVNRRIWDVAFESSFFEFVKS